MTFKNLVSMRLILHIGHSPLHIWIQYLKDLRASMVLFTKTFERIKNDEKEAIGILKQVSDMFVKSLSLDNNDQCMYIDKKCKMCPIYKIQDNTSCDEYGSMWAELYNSFSRILNYALLEDFINCHKAFLIARNKLKGFIRHLEYYLFNKSNKKKPGRKKSIPRICEFPGCKRKTHGRVDGEGPAYCRMHYSRAKRQKQKSK